MPVNIVPLCGGGYGLAGTATLAMQGRAALHTPSAADRAASMLRRRHYSAVEPRKSPPPHCRSAKGLTPGNVRYASSYVRSASTGHLPRSFTPLEPPSRAFRPAVQTSSPVAARAMAQAGDEKAARQLLRASIEREPHRPDHLFASGAVTYTEPLSASLSFLSAAERCVRRSNRPAACRSCASCLRLAGGPLQVPAALGRLRGLGGVGALGGGGVGHAAARCASHARYTLDLRLRCVSPVQHACVSR